MSDNAPGEKRRLELLELYAADSTRPGEDVLESLVGSGHSSAYLEIPTLELRRQGRSTAPIRADNVRRTIDYVDERRDCADFGLAALLRMLHRYDEHLPSDLRSAITATVRDAVYWFDVAEAADADVWFSTENHQILHHVAELLAGQYLPETTFGASGRDGAHHREQGARRVRRWLDWRLRFGFSEWLSNTYYDEDLAALLNLVDFAEDHVIRERARRLVDVTLFEMAANTHYGVFGSTHGRTYAGQIFDPGIAPTSATTYLAWGDGSPSGTLSRSAVALATSEYRVPAVVRRIGRDRGPIENRQRQGLDVEDAAEYGLDPGDPNNQLFFLGSLVMGHDAVAETALSVCPERYHNRYREIEPAVRYHERHAGTADHEPDPNNTALTESNVYTYRTPAYMLSCVQDYRPGTYGFQQHVWQATLDDDALVFTNHPQAPADDASRDSYWARNGVLPRAAAHRTVCCGLYRVGDPPFTPPDIPGFDESLAEVPFTHAYVPRHAFDDWVETGGWVFGRAGDGYVAITTPQPTEWREPDPTITDLLVREVDTAVPPYELVADARECVWVCEVGDEETYGSFEEFVAALADRSVSGGIDGMAHESPELGRVAFGWDEPFVVDGREIPLEGYPRFDNPYARTPFEPPEGAALDSLPAFRD